MLKYLQRTTTCGQSLSWRWNTGNRQAANREIRDVILYWNNWKQLLATYYIYIYILLLIPF